MKEFIEPKVGEKIMTEEFKKSDNVDKDNEKENIFNPQVYITDHSADLENTGSPDKLRKLYAGIKNDGIDAVRYDWRWNRIEAEQGKYDAKQIDRYSSAKQLMSEAGLAEPTIILSSPPEWASELYKKDKEQFFESYRKYAEQVKNSLASLGGKVDRVQIFNELNNPVFSKIKIEDYPRICEITREVFVDYNPDLKLIASISAGTGPELTTLGNKYTFKTFMSKLENIKDSFDIYSIDYYPGFWHQAIKGTDWKFEDLKHGKILKPMYKNLDYLKKLFERIATWDKEYELDEAGLPSRAMFGGEKGQRYFYDVFFKAFRAMARDFEDRGIKVPSGIGMYQAIDEDVMKMGMTDLEGNPKLIRQGHMHATEEERKTQSSRISEIIRYLKQPRIPYDLEKDVIK